MEEFREGGYKSSTGERKSSRSIHVAELRKRSSTNPTIETSPEDQYDESLGETEADVETSTEEGEFRAESKQYLQTYHVEIDDMEPPKRCMHAYCNCYIAFKNAGNTCKVCKKNRCMTPKCDHQIHVKNRLMRCTSCKRFKCRKCVGRSTHYHKDEMPPARCNYCSTSREEGLDLTTHREPTEKARLAANKGVGSLVARWDKVRDDATKAEKQFARKKGVGDEGHEDGISDNDVEDAEVESLEQGDNSPETHRKG
jgi:hypothetical protein